MLCANLTPASQEAISVCLYSFLSAVIRRQPNWPAVGGGERVKGAARGALGGAAIGAIAGDAGQGAGIGAVVGTAAGGRRARQNRVAQNQQAVDQQQNL